MVRPTDVYRIVGDGAIERFRGVPLVIALSGFSDAGSAVAQFSAFVAEEAEPETLVSFVGDELVDYRARRPVLSFAGDHIESIEPPRLELVGAVDDFGRPFLALLGYEPDYRWDVFVAAVLEVVDLYGVESTTLLASIGMPVPHTRPIVLTVSGSRTDLVDTLSAWKPTTQSPSSVANVIELRLHERGDSVASLILLVPHYLAEAEHPMALLAALESVTAATGLVFPTDRVREAGREFLSRVDEQVTGNAELETMIASLEERHDAYMEGTQLRSPLTEEDGTIPTAEKIASELERFLAGRPDGDDGGPLRF